MTSFVAMEPQWWQTFRDAYRAAAATGKARTPDGGFLAALEPIMTRARASVRSQLSRTRSSLIPRGRKDQRELSSSLEQTLRERLSLAVTKTLVLELAVAGRAGLLKGGTPEERFAFFCECLRDPGFAAPLLARYPVLVRRLQRHCDRLGAGDGGLARPDGSMRIEIATSLFR